ncbi:uncharacterized protein JCM6883_006927 [Sporobolomyces salmoneus]|uniref:uncharacterized protein n=1 Tax=Sporobolomyces salmoneus TaxID=183962 RepID=UPI003172A8B0
MGGAPWSFAVAVIKSGRMEGVKEAKCQHLLIYFFFLLAIDGPIHAMLSDNFLTRSLVRLSIVAVDTLPVFALLHTIAAYATYPAPPALALPIANEDFIFQHKFTFSLISLWLALEVVWWPIVRIWDFALDRGYLDSRQNEKITSEERWRLWVKLLEATESPEDWLQSFFLIPGRTKAPRGADDPAIKGVDLEKIGRTNIEEMIAHLMFNVELRKIKPKSIERAEMNSMVQLLETTLTLSRSSESPPFKFRRGKSPNHVYLLSRERLSLGHKPLIFYAFTWFASQMGCLLLRSAGFRYFGPRTTWPLPLFCSSTRSLESVHDRHERLKMESTAQLSEKISYWFKPASGKAREEDQRPVIVCHGISGTYGPACFIAFLSYLSGRAMFVPVHPYLSMRLSPPSTIITRQEYVAAVRRMLWRHGFGLTCLDRDEDDPDDHHEVDEEEESGNGKDVDEEWRRGKAIVVAHSAGSGMAGWLMRDAPDVVAGLVLIDPMSFLLYCPDSARNFYRTKAKTAGEYFFKYFASERGINSYMSRHVLWSTSTLFSPNPVSTLPDEIKKQVIPKCARWRQEAGYDVPRYAAEVNGLQDGGAFPTVVFLSGNDCILPIPKLIDYFSKSKFGKIVEGSTPSRLRLRRAAETATVNGSATTKELVKEAKDGADEGSVRIMTGLEHAAILVRVDWCREVSKAIEQVGKKAEEWEHRERIELVQ